MRSTFWDLSWRQTRHSVKLYYETLKPMISQHLELHWQAIPLFLKRFALWRTRDENFINMFHVLYFVINCQNHRLRSLTYVTINLRKAFICWFSHLLTTHTDLQHSIWITVDSPPSHWFHCSKDSQRILPWVLQLRSCHWVETNLMISVLMLLSLGLTKSKVQLIFHFYSSLICFCFSLFLLFEFSSVECCRLFSIEKMFSRKHKYRFAKDFEGVASCCNNGMLGYLWEQVLFVSIWEREVCIVRKKHVTTYSLLSLLFPFWLFYFDCRRYFVWQWQDWRWFLQ